MNKQYTKAMITDALHSSNLIERTILHFISFCAFTLIGVFLLKHQTLIGYLSLATCCIADIIIIYNIVRNCVYINKIKSGKFQHIKDTIISIESCSAIIPGRADFLNVKTETRAFYIHKILNDGFKTGDKIDAVFLGTENVPIHIAKIETTEVDDESKISKNQNKGFFTPMIPLILAVLIISIIALVSLFFK